MTSDHESCDANLDGFPVPAGGASAEDGLDRLLTQFMDEVRRGLNPSVSEYAFHHREWAEQIRELFPLVQTLERWKTDKEVDLLRQNVPESFPVPELAGYNLVRELGRGGMGIVFEAVQTRTARRVALKFLPWRYAANMQRWVDRFRHEAKTIARLRHPGIVRVYSFGQQRGHCYYAMQLIPGVSLDKIIRTLRESDTPVFVRDLREAPTGPQVIPPAAVIAGSSTDRSTAAGSAHAVNDGSVGAAGAASVSPAATATTGLRRDAWRAFADIGLQVALALAHAHQRRVLHFDVKPANLLLTEPGSVVVTDFGIGRSAEEQGAGSPDQQVGTLRYMAPERLRGSCDARSDVYSLGATLYELVTCTPAFDAPDRRQLVELISRAQPPRPRALVPQIPRPLEAIVLKAMAERPADRYASALELAADLKRFLDGQPVACQPLPLGHRVRQALDRWFSV